MAVAEARTSFSSSEIFDREMYHLYVMSNGEGIGLFGERYIDARSRGIDKVRAGDCASPLKRTFGSMRFNAALAEAGASSPSLGMSGPAPAIETLPNGITAEALERPGSPVAALHLLFEGRNCAEQASAGGPIGGSGPRGLAELFGTVMRVSSDGAELTKELDAMGARVHFGDNAFVPMDDYILSPAFSFVRLECPAASIDRAVSLLVKRLLAFDFTNDDLDAAKKTLARELGMRSGSPGFVLRGAIYSELFGAHPLGASIFPAPPAVQPVTADELAAFARKYLVGGNIIASFVSSEEPEQAIARLKPLLAAFPAGAAAACPPIPLQAKSGPVDMPTRKEGAYISASWLVPAAGPAESASILVAAEALSRRMQLELREKLGLAYSTDCATALVPGGAIVTASLGTGAARLAEARSALEAEIKGFGEHPPDAAEAAIAKSRLIGKRTRSELSSINKAYALGLDLFLGGAKGYQPMNGLIASAPLDGVTKVIASTLAYDKALRVTLVPEARPAAEGKGAMDGKETKETMPKPSMPPMPPMKMR
jgi:predicted Zn-dependent peptidase